MNDKMKELKNKYNEIEIPNELDECIKKAMEKGKGEMINMDKKNKKNRWIKGVASGVVAASVAFTIGVNTMPAFANSMIDVPVIGTLVKVIQINEGTASGGRTTDGDDVKSINIQDNNDSQRIIIGIEKNNRIANTVPSFKVDYKNYPHTMTFTISGARKLSAEKYFESLKENKFVSDVYKLITFDDSMVRFNVVFNTPVKYEVKEYKDPAQIVVNLTKDDKALNKPVYSIRTASYTNGETIGYMEEIIGIDTARVIKDEKGTFLVEAGIFDSEQKAKEKIEELTKNSGSDLKLYVEKRNSGDIPKVISE